MLHEYVRTGAARSKASKGTIEMHYASRAPKMVVEPRLRLKIFAVMTVTTLLTFGSLVTGYEMLCARQLYA